MTALPWRDQFGNPRRVASTVEPPFLTATAESRPTALRRLRASPLKTAFVRPLRSMSVPVPSSARSVAPLLKVEQLRSVIDLFPSTIWAKRAGVVPGVDDRARPGRGCEATACRTRTRGIIDDYLRLWIAEALVKQTSRFRLPSCWR